MPTYTDPKQEAAYQAYEQPLLQQRTAANRGMADRYNMAGRNDSWDRNQFAQKWASDQAIAKAQADKDAATSAANANTSQAYGLANADLSRASSNPTDDLIRSTLAGKLNSNVLDPNAKPYSDQTINALMVGQGQTAAAAESARNQQLMDSVAANGGSAFDPGIRSALQQSLTQRQNQVSDSQLNINQQSGIANFNAEQNARLQNNNAQMQAAGSLQGQNNAQQARQTGASQNYQNMLTGQRFSTTGGAQAAPTASTLAAQPAPATSGFGAFQQAMQPQKPAAAPAAYRPYTRR